MGEVLAKDVMIKRVYTIRPNRKIALARLRMLRHGVGALPVIDENNLLVGIVTLRDTDFARVYNLLVEDLMTTDLTTDNADTPILKIADKMLQRGVERLPITDKDEKLIGLITQRTLIRALKKMLDKHTQNMLFQ